MRQIMNKVNHTPRQRDAVVCLEGEPLNGLETGTFIFKRCSAVLFGQRFFINLKKKKFTPHPFSKKQKHNSYSRTYTFCIRSQVKVPCLYQADINLNVGLPASNAGQATD